MPYPQIKKWGVRTFTFILFALFALGALPPADAASSAAAQARHMLWAVSDGKGNAPGGYLVGSVHILKPDVYPLDKVYEDAFKNAGELVFELDLDTATAKTPGLIRQLGIYPKGKSLKTELSPKTYAQLQTVAKKLGIPPQLLNPMKPWLVSFTLTLVQLQKAGYSSAAGIDKHFYDKAKQAGKKIGALETAQYQFELFANLSPAQQEKLLASTLDQAEKGPALFAKITDSWKKGDAARLNKLINEDMRDAPKLYQALVVQRNKNWVPKIVEMMAKGQRPMVIVGAAHVIGKHGLVSLLRSKGYTVTQQ